MIVLTTKVIPANVVNVVFNNSCSFQLILSLMLLLKLSLFLSLFILIFKSTFNAIPIHLLPKPEHRYYLVHCPCWGRNPMP